MKNAKKNTSTNVTAKATNNLASNLRNQYATLTGIVKAASLADDLTKEDKSLLAVVGISGRMSKDERQAVAGKLYDQSLYYYTDLEGKKHPADRRTRKNEEGKTVAYYVARKKEGWTFKKLSEAIRVVSGSKEQKMVEIEESK